MAKFALPVAAFEDLLQALTFDVYDDAMESLEASRPMESPPPAR